jgi:hypothetical protein
MYWNRFGKTLTFSVLLSLTGCLSAPRLARELSKDNAAVSVRVTSIYGTATILRANPDCCHKAVLSPDGTITITPQ